MRLRSGLDKSSEREDRSQPAQAASLGMEEHRFTDFGSNGADFGSSSQSGSPYRPEIRNCDSSNGQQAQGIVLSNQREEYQESPIASSHYTQRTCSAPPSFYDPALYPEAPVSVLYPTTSASYSQPYTTLTTSQPQAQLQLQHDYPSYMAAHTDAPQSESIYSYASSSYPYPPPPPAPTPPPALPNFSRLQPSQYDPQAHLPYHQVQTPYHHALTQPQPQTPYLPSLRPSLPTLSTSQTQLQTHQPHHQFQDAPWSPLSAHESRKRRASDALSSAEMGVPDADSNWGYKDKMGQELDSLEMESRSMRRDERGEGSARTNVPGSSRRTRRRRRRLNYEDVGTVSAGRRQGGRDEDEDEDENEVEYRARMARGEEEEHDRGNGHAYS
ncbi:hypothetical protein EAE96_008643 [Botrytis aclada]|nr:hypothetical protein EAE96_008643 [Botrytis aclada]